MNVCGRLLPVTNCLRRVYLYHHHSLHFIQRIFPIDITCQLQVGKYRTLNKDLSRKMQILHV